MATAKDKPTPRFLSLDYIYSVDYCEWYSDRKDRVDHIQLSPEFVIPWEQHGSLAWTRSCAIGRDLSSPYNEKNESRKNIAREKTLSYERSANKDFRNWRARCKLHDWVAFISQSQNICLSQHQRPQLLVCKMLSCYALFYIHWDNSVNVSPLCVSATVEKSLNSWNYISIRNN